MTKILIAEDDRGARELFGTTVESLGYWAILAENGKIAWDILNNNNDISFIITDVSMPVMDGATLIIMIRQDQRFSSIPILAVSGAIRAKEIVGLLEQGATWFMAKPVNMAELINLIQQHCRKQVP